MNPFRRKGPSTARKGLPSWLGWARALPVVFKRALNALLPLPGVSAICLEDQEVPVVTSGVFNGHRFTEAVLKELVETYNFAAQPAPIKLTHADKQGPAAGWVKALRLGEYTPPGQTKPKKALLATLAPNELGRAKVKSGEFLMRSIEAWPPTHPSNPTPGKWNFKALALLGTDSPACPNLGPLQLAEGASEVEVPVLALGLDDESLPTHGGKQPPATDEGAAMALTPEQQAALDKAAETQKALDTATKKNTDLEAKLAAQALAHDTAEVKASLADLVKASKLTPAQAEVLAPVLLALPAEGEVKLADGKTAKPREALMAVLSEGAAHGLKTPLKVPGKAPVELAAGKGTKSKAMAELVAKYKAAGKTHADAVACAAQDLDNDGQ